MNIFSKKVSNVFYLFFLFVIINVLTSSNDYNTQRIAACRVAEYWQKGPTAHTKDIVGYNYNTAFFVQTGSDVCNNRINLFSPGLYKPTKTLRTLSFTEDFQGLPERTLTGWLPGDFFIFDPEFCASNKETFRKKLSWGQNKDAFALIYSLNSLYNAGIKEFTVHGQCFGTCRLVHALYYLSCNEQSNQVNNFFLKANIDRIRKEELMGSIKTICLQTPLKQASDSLISGADSIIAKPIFAIKLLSALTSQYFLAQSSIYHDGSNSNQLLLQGIGIFALPVIISLSNSIFNLDKKIIRNSILPNYCTYDGSHPDEIAMLKKIAHIKNDYPEKSFFMTTAKNDRVVGDWNVAEFFNEFPVCDEQKYLIPSPQFGHCKVNHDQIKAKNAFLRKYGSSYYKFPEQILKEGEEILDFAQKGQATDIHEYIEYMESTDNTVAF